MPRSHSTAANTAPEGVIGTVSRFNDAFNAHDVEAMMRLMTADCMFDNTGPAPDGMRYEGSEAVKAYWQGFFRTSPRARIEIEEMVALGSHCVMRWIYHWVDNSGHAGHVRGIDLYRLDGGLIAEKLSYVKG